MQSVVLGCTRVAHIRENIDAFGRGPLLADVSAAADAVGVELRGPRPAYNR
ncbi:hypothetical protein [Mycetocola miduiensis]|uniref:hypothetical protein n=1 Tax=Mycetocola miduiensis TaxID=995034 RepID=UPI0015A59B5F|nr:hypothetical protein [Mycetocola miduiensis]